MTILASNIAEALLGLAFINQSKNSSKKRSACSPNSSIKLLQSRDEFNDGFNGGFNGGFNDGFNGGFDGGFNESGR
ncbi:hypothetical protein AJ78_06467 [Emergomyces pasteurianus Ep9510]|uniref:Uncharacterized protein n=1 Tax=Emergomyces pasteurianus Ep9510 TaxID=1447872 RepID=A0A1J9P8U4_9EURO|nr:hypothetical protein AJ78_06467 [Emergomyces pasteurianus Ep9510]